MVERRAKHNISYLVPWRFLNGETAIACPLCDLEAPKGNKKGSADIAEKIDKSEKKFQTE